MRCPIKSTKEWKMLVKQVGENLADITYVSYNYNIPDVKSISEIKKAIGFKSTVENLAPISAKIKRYNQQNGTSHYFTKEKAYGNTFKLELKLNYLPVNVEKQRQRQAERSTIYRVEELNDEAFSELYGDIEPAYTPSPSEMEAGRFNEEGDFLPVDDMVDELVATAPDKVKAVEIQKTKALKSKLNNAIIKYRMAEDPTSLRVAELEISRLKEQMEATKIKKEEASTISNFETTLAFADRQLAEIEKMLESPNIPYSDILYGKRAANLWIAAGDQSAEPGLHIILDEDERNTPEIANAFAERAVKAQRLKQKLDVIAKNHMTRFVRKYTDKNLSEEEIYKNLKDINKVASLTLNLGRTEDSLLTAIMYAVEEANKLAQDEANVVWDDLDKLGEKVIKKLGGIGKGNPYDIFKQVTEDGYETGRMVTRFSAEYYDMMNTLVKRAFHRRNKKGEKIKSPKDIENYYNFIKENTVNMDVRLLMPDSLLEDSNAPKSAVYTRVTPSEEQIAAHKADLIQQLGEKGYKKYMERLEKKIYKFQLKRDAIWDSLSLEEGLTEKEKLFLFDEWNRENSPYWALDMVDNPASRKKPDGKSFYSPKGLRDHTYQIPRRVLKSGKKTKWYDKNFDKIEADEDLSAFHELITETLYQIMPIMPEGKRKLLGVNILPFIEKSIMDQFQDKGMMMGITPFWDKLKQVVTTTDLAESDTADQDPLTLEREKNINTQFIVDVNSKVKDIVKTKTIQYRQENGVPPNLETLKKFEKEARDYLSKQKSWDLVKIMKAYSLMGLAYKHKSFIEPQIKLAEQFFNKKKQIVQNKAGFDKKNISSGEIVTEEGLQNYKEMLKFFLDSDFYSTGARKVEGASKKKLYSKEDKKRKKELEALLEEANESEREILQKEIDALGANITGSGIGDAALKFMTLKGLGWNVFSAVSNIGFGAISNVIEGSDNRNYTASEMRKAYMLTLNSVGKNLTEYTPFMPAWEGKNGNAYKIRQLMDQWDLLKTSNKELYDMSNQSSFGKGLRKFGPMTLQERSEYLNYAPTMIAVMLHTKLATDPEGNKVSMWEAYDKFGKIKEGYTVEGTEEELVRKIRRVIEMNHGDYNNPLMIKKTFAGRAVSQFRTWMFEGFANRFEGEKVDHALSYGLEEPYIRKGRYRSYTQGQLATTAATVGTFILPGIGTLAGGALGYFSGRFFGLDQERNGLSDTLFTLKQLARKLMFQKTQFDERGFSKVDAANMRKNMTELLMFVGLASFTLLLKAMLPDDDEDKEAKDNFALNFLLNQSTRLQTDIAFYTNPLEFEKLTKTAVPLAQLISDVAIWSADVVRYFDDDPKNDVFQSGPFKGESKALVHFGQILPGSAQAIRLYKTGTVLYDK